MYLEPTTKRIFAIACLGKKLVFHTEILRISQITNFKNRSFSSGHGVVQIKPNSVWSIPCVTGVKYKKNFCYSLPRKKVSFSYGNFANFANNEF